MGQKTFHNASFWDSWACLINELYIIIIFKSIGLYAMGLCFFYFFFKLWNFHKSLVHLIYVYPIEKYSSALKFTVFATNSFLIFKLAQ